MCLCGVCMSKGLCVCLSVCVHVLSGAHIHVEIDIGSFSLSLSTLFVQTWSPAAPELTDSVYLACDLQDPPVFRVTDTPTSPGFLPGRPIVCKDSHTAGCLSMLLVVSFKFKIITFSNFLFSNLWH